MLARPTPRPRRRCAWNRRRRGERERGGTSRHSPSPRFCTPAIVLHPFSSFVSSEIGDIFLLPPPICAILARPPPEQFPIITIVSVIETIVSVIVTIVFVIVTIVSVIEMMFSGFETIFSGIETSDSSIDARVFLVETKVSIAGKMVSGSEKMFSVIEKMCSVIEKMFS